MDGVACKAAMITATRLRIHLQSIKLIRNIFLSFRIPASSAAGAQEKLVEDFDAVVQQIRAPDVTKYADQCILPSVQNIQDTDSHLQQRVLDEARRKVEAQGLALAKTLTVNISELEAAEKDCDQDTEASIWIIDSQSLLQLEPISEDSLNDAHVDVIQLSSIELSLDLKRNGEIRVSDNYKVEYCIRGWNGIIDAKNQSDAALVDVSRSKFDHDNSGFSVSDSDWYVRSCLV
jgi:hypothetical protein